MSANLGFETIGNATITVFDNARPIITTDPWIEGAPYFGSWGHSYKVPKNQKKIFMTQNSFGYLMGTQITWMCYQSNNLLTQHS